MVEGAASCVTLEVELADGATHHGSACPDSSGAAQFALPLPLSGSGSSGQPGRILVRQAPSASGAPGRLWQQLIATAPSVHLSIDMRQAEVVPPLPAPAPTIPAAVRELAEPAPTCTHPSQPPRCCTDLEDAADRSFPAYQSLAFPAPTCLAPQPSSPPSTAALPSIQQPRLGMLAGLAAACAVQAVAIAVLLARQCSSGSPVMTSATGGQQTAEEAAAPVRRRTALIDACTSPLALLASPFVRSRRQSGEGLESIPEEPPGQQAAGQRPAGQQQAYDSPVVQQGHGGSPQLQQQGQPGGSYSQQAGSFGSMAPAPAGWTRWVGAWGRGRLCSGLCVLVRPKPPCAQAGICWAQQPTQQQSALQGLRLHPPAGMHGAAFSGCLAAAPAPAPGAASQLRSTHRPLALGHPQPTACQAPCTILSGGSSARSEGLAASAGAGASCNIQHGSSCSLQLLQAVTAGGSAPTEGSADYMPRSQLNSKGQYCKGIKVGAHSAARRGAAWRSDGLGTVCACVCVREFCACCVKLGGPEGNERSERKQAGSARSG